MFKKNMERLNKDHRKFCVNSIFTRSQQQDRTTTKQPNNQPNNQTNKQTTNQPNKQTNKQTNQTLDKPSKLILTCTVSRDELFCMFKIKEDEMELTPTNHH